MIIKLDHQTLVRRFYHRPVRQNAWEGVLRGFLCYVVDLGCGSLIEDWQWLKQILEGLLLVGVGVDETWDGIPALVAVVILKMMPFVRSTENCTGCMEYERESFSFLD